MPTPIRNAIGRLTKTFTANGTTDVVVADKSVRADSNIVITLKTVGGTVGETPTILTKTAGTGFTVDATASDTSLYNYVVI